MFSIVSNVIFSILCSVSGVNKISAISNVSTVSSTGFWQ